MPRSFKSIPLVAVAVALAVVTSVVVFWMKGGPGADGGEYSVVDGDTIELRDVGRVRYIGIDAPERDEPFYDEARQYNERLLSEGEMSLSYGRERYDRYGRTLAYVYVRTEAGRLVFVNEEMVRAGWAKKLEIPPNTEFAPRFRRAEEEARRYGRGMWAAGPRNGES
jgi:micrococcal nuclease